MKLIGLSLILFLSALLIKDKNLTINYTQVSAEFVPYSNKDELPKKQIWQVSPEQALIIGRWRGYRETPEFTIYYGYEFRPNGVYVARHRVYQQEKTILDQYWQGKWNFDGQILTLEGTVTDGKQVIFKYNFRLDKDNLLYYQDGDLPEPYLPEKMGKLS